MCRLFGLVANKEVNITFSMLEASNNFKRQGKNNPHGWGIGWYENELPRLEKYGEDAFHSNKFDQLVKIIKSRIFVAHVRFASSGNANTDKNAHPFIYKEWMFAHNGTIDKYRIKSLLTAPFNKDFTSEPIDSEVYFRYIIQCIDQEGNPLQGIKKSVKEVVKNARGANFILSNGKKFFAFRYNRELFWLTRDPSSPLNVLSKETNLLFEAKKLAFEKAVLVASEKLTQDENWIEISDGELLIVDKSLNIKKENLLW